MRCGQEKCDKDAEFIVYWPGQTTFQCDEHTKKVVALGKFMGFNVSTNPITVIDAEQQTADNEDKGNS
jgi:hypothetical protein